MRELLSAWYHSYWAFTSELLARCSWSGISRGGPSTTLRSGPPAQYSFKLSYILFQNLGFDCSQNVFERHRKAACQEQSPSPTTTGDSKDKASTATEVPGPNKLYGSQTWQCSTWTAQRYFHFCWSPMQRHHVHHNLSISKSQWKSSSSETPSLKSAGDLVYLHVSFNSSSETSQSSSLPNGESFHFQPRDDTHELVHAWSGEKSPLSFASNNRSCRNYKDEKDQISCPCIV